MRFVTSGLILTTTLGVRVEILVSKFGDYRLLYDGLEVGAGVMSFDSGWYEIGEELYLQHYGRSFSSGLGVVENALFFTGKDGYGVQ
ncbi:MAG: hypothetical protein ACKOW9_00470 [Candidatus Paceibacterota bacterium]